MQLIFIMNSLPPHLLVELMNLEFLSSSNLKGKDCRLAKHAQQNQLFTIFKTTSYTVNKNKGVERTLNRVGTFSQILHKTLLHLSALSHVHELGTAKYVLVLPRVVPCKLGRFDWRINHMQQR